MSVHASAEVEIHRTPSEVAAYMFDPSRESEWADSVEEAKANGKLEIGAQITRRANILDKTFTYTAEVIDYEEGVFLEMAAQEPYPMNIRYELVMVPDGTLVQIETEYESNGFFPVEASQLSPRIHDMLEGDLKTLKRQLEG